MVLHAITCNFMKKREGKVGTVSTREDNIATQAEWNNGSHEFGKLRKHSFASP